VNDVSAHRGAAFHRDAHRDRATGFDRPAAHEPTGRDGIVELDQPLAAGSQSHLASAVANRRPVGHEGAAREDEREPGDDCRAREDRVDEREGDQTHDRRHRSSEARE
jgi:hypothetical protein